MANNIYDPSFYKRLSVERNASQAEIKKAYRVAILKGHPDKNEGTQKAEEHTKEINEAFAGIKNKEARKKYDFSLDTYLAQKANEERQKNASEKKRKEEENRKKEQEEKNKQQQNTSGFSYNFDPFAKPNSTTPFHFQKFLEDPNVNPWLKVAATFLLLFNSTK